MTSRGISGLLVVYIREDFLMFSSVGSTDNSGVPSPIAVDASVLLLPAVVVAVAKGTFFVIFAGEGF